MEATLASRPPDALRLPKDTMLLVIDVQQGFDQFPNRNNPAMEANLAALLKAWRKMGRRIIHVRHDSVEEKSVFRPELPGNAFKPEALPLPREPVIAKSVHSAFIGTELEDRLERGGHETLVLCGIQTNYCVASTARMAGNLGYKTFVVGDACATFDQKLLSGDVVKAQLVHDLALGELHGEFATVISTQDLLAALSK